MGLSQLAPIRTGRTAPISRGRRGRLLAVLLALALVTVALTGLSALPRLRAWGGGPGQAGRAAPAAAAGGARVEAAAPLQATTVSSTYLPLVSGDLWRPGPGTSWQWQLSGLPVDQTVDVQMYDVDLFETSAAVVASLHDEGRWVVCYMNAGAWEEWAPDADAFPAEVLGRGLDGWPGERWLDIRRLDVLGPIMEARLDLCKRKGFDAVEPDNVDGYANGSGFPLTAQDQLAYNRFLARAAHARGLSIGLKNDLDQVGELLGDFDWALNEECFAYDECELLTPFIAAGKAVFHVEYELEPSAFCAQTRALGFSSLKKNLSLDAYRVPC